MNVSDHAVLRHLERTGGMEARHNRVRKLVAFGKEIYPRDRLRKLLNHNCQIDRYYLKDDLVAVVSNDTVVTVYKFEPEKWQEQE